MRVGLVVPGFSAGEDDWCIPALRNLAEELSTRHSTQVLVLALRYPARRGRYRVLGTNVLALGGNVVRGAGSARLWVDAVATLVGEHRRRPFDVLHAFWADEPGLVVGVTGRLLGVPTLVSLAGGEPVGLPDIGYGGRIGHRQRAKARLALWLADTIAAGSRHELDLARDWLRPGRQRVARAPLGVDLRLFSPARAGEGPAGTGGRMDSSEPPALLQAASLVPVKDQALLLRTLAHLRGRGSNCRLELVGAGVLESDLRRLADRLGVADLVTFSGALPHDALPTVYRHAALFVQTSRHEAQGMAVLEAAACGLPTVGTAVGVLPELAPDAGRAVVAGSAEALADAITSVLRDPEARAAMGRSAMIRAEDEFSLAGCTARFRDLYESSSKRPRRAGRGV